MHSGHPGDSPFPVKIRYEYEKNPKCQLIYAHGVWGGINPHGEIELNLYSESDKLPSTAERIINADGSVGPEMSPEDQQTKTLVRTVHARVLVSHQTARAIIEWLQEKVQALDIDGGELPFAIDENKGPAQ